MRSRYDLAQNGTTDGEGGYYPDICSIPLDKFRYTEAPKEHYLTEKEIERIDIFIFNEYGTSEFDDILLWLNNIDDIYSLSADTKILIPTKTDMENFYYTYRE
jgi:hypothetical protein